MPTRNPDVDFDAASAVIVDRSIDGSDDASVAINVTTVAIDATVLVELVRHVEVEREPVDAADVHDSGNRGKEG